MNRAFGRAVPSTSMDITVTMDMTAVYPTQGSTEGGTLLVITGSGFGDPDNIQITVGGNPCPLYEFTDNYCVTTNTCEPKPVISYESLTCVAPASTGGRRELSPGIISLAQSKILFEFQVQENLCMFGFLQW